MRKRDIDRKGLNNYETVLICGPIFIIPVVNVPKILQRYKYFTQPVDKAF